MLFGYNFFHKMYVPITLRFLSRLTQNLHMNSHEDDLYYRTELKHQRHTSKNDQVFKLLRKYTTQSYKTLLKDNYCSFCM